MFFVFVGWNRHFIAFSCTAYRTVYKDLYSLYRARPSARPSPSHHQTKAHI